MKSSDRDAAGGVLFGYLPVFLTDPYRMFRGGISDEETEGEYQRISGCVPGCCTICHVDNHSPAGTGCYPGFQRGAGAGEFQQCQLLDFQHLLQPYLDHFGIPYSVRDVGTSPLGTDLGSFAVILIGHRELDPTAVIWIPPKKASLRALYLQAPGWSISTTISPRLPQGIPRISPRSSASRTTTPPPVPVLS